MCSSGPRTAILSAEGQQLFGMVCVLQAVSGLSCQVLIETQSLHTTPQKKTSHGCSPYSVLCVTGGGEAGSVLRWWVGISRLGEDADS